MRNGPGAFTPQVPRERHGPCPVLPRRLCLQTRQAIHLAETPKDPGLSIVRVDYEYKRNGTANLFMFLDAHQPWRHVKVTEQRPSPLLRARPDGVRSLALCAGSAAQAGRAAQWRTVQELGAAGRTGADPPQVGRICGR